MKTLIIVVIGLVLTILGGYFIGTSIAKILSEVNKTMLIPGLVMFAIGIVILAIFVVRIFRKS